jgi:hypothetical protein
MIQADTVYKCNFWQQTKAWFSVTWAPFPREGPTDDIQTAGLLRELMLPLQSATLDYYTEQHSSQQVCCAVQRYDIQKSQNPLCTYTVFWETSLRLSHVFANTIRHVDVTCNICCNKQERVMNININCPHMLTVYGRCTATFGSLSTSSVGSWWWNSLHKGPQCLD